MDDEQPAAGAPCDAAPGTDIPPPEAKGRPGSIVGPRAADLTEFWLTPQGWLEFVGDPAQDSVDSVPLAELDPDTLLPRDVLDLLRRELFAAPVETLDATTREAMIAAARAPQSWRSQP
ncbi:MAG: hypothetical protein ACT4PP_01030 [Sporichthyaceae bacterium]